MSTAVKREALLNYFSTSLGLDQREIDDDTPLFSSNLIDSLGMIELIMFIDTKIGIRIEPEDVTLDNFDSVSRILKFVDSTNDR